MFNKVAYKPYKIYYKKNWFVFNHRRDQIECGKSKTKADLRLIEELNNFKEIVKARNLGWCVVCKEWVVQVFPELPFS